MAPFHPWLRLWVRKLLKLLGGAGAELHLVRNFCKKTIVLWPNSMLITSQKTKKNFNACCKYNLFLVADIRIS